MGARRATERGAWRQTLARVDSRSALVRQERDGEGLVDGGVGGQAHGDNFGDVLSGGAAAVGRTGVRLGRDDAGRHVRRGLTTGLETPLICRHHLHRAAVGPGDEDDRRRTPNLCKCWLEGDVLVDEADVEPTVDGALLNGDVVGGGVGEHRFPPDEIAGHHTVPTKRDVDLDRGCGFVCGRGCGFGCGFGCGLLAGGGRTRAAHQESDQSHCRRPPPPLVRHTIMVWIASQSLGMIPGPVRGDELWLDRFAVSRPRP
jgi:hypothetical protein